MDLRLKSHKPGDDITVMQTLIKRFMDEDNHFREVLQFIYKDNKTGIKFKEEYEDPQYEYYVIKPEYRVPYNRTFVPIENCVRHQCKRTRLERDIYNALGMRDIYEQRLREGDRKAIRSIHRDPDVFLSDNNIEDHYRFWFANEYQNTICPITKSFFDIEVDGIEIARQFPEMGECPVNAITVVFAHRMETYTFLLRNPKNPLIAQFEEELKAHGTNELKEFVLNHVSEFNHNEDGSPFYFGLENMKFNITFYDDEILMINDFFRAMNTFKPDFAMAWNQSFDIPYLIERIKVLGYNPEDIICHPDFKYKDCYYFIDERAKNEFEERCDYFSCSSYTVYLDQMIQYASRRKGQTKTLSYALDAIGSLVAKVRKLDYKDITQQIEELPYKDYKTFVFYNICDTIVQYCIEYFTQDVDYVFGKVLMNNTRYAKIHRQTVYLTNRGQDIFWKCGFVKGNNVNLNNESTPYPGAFVADPLKVNDYSRVKIGVSYSNIFDNLSDSDFKSLYPSIMRQFNVFAHTQIGFIMIAKHIHNKQNKNHYQYYTAGGQFLEDLQTHNWLEFGCRWFGLQSFEDLVEYTRDIFTTEIKPVRPLAHKRVYTDEGYYYPFTNYGKYYFPFYQVKDRDGYYRPFHNVVSMSPELVTKLGEWKKDVVRKPNQSF